jgi:hypothetical protein
MMKRMIYASSAVSNTSFESVIDMLTQATQRNKELGITGIMVFDGKQFLQCIEGDNSTVDGLKAKIFSDQRHTDIFLHGEEEIAQRLFSDWSMGYVNRESSIRKVLEKISGTGEFHPELLSYAQAKLIMLELSSLI